MTTATTPGIQLNSGGRPRLSAGSWRVDPVRSHAWFAARVADRLVRGRLPLTGGVLIAEPAEDSTARLAARASAVSTGSPVLDRLLTGPGFLDARAFPEIIFRSKLLVRVPAGWRAVGCLRVKKTEYELACQLDLRLGGMRPGGSPRTIVASRRVMDSGWVTTRWVPALGRRMVMTCSFSLGPEMSTARHYPSPVRAGRLPLAAAAA